MSHDLRMPEGMSESEIIQIDASILSDISFHNILYLFLLPQFTKHAYYKKNRFILVLWIRKWQPKKCLLWTNIEIKRKVYALSWVVTTKQFSLNWNYFGRHVYTYITSNYKSVFTKVVWCYYITYVLPIVRSR